MVYHTCPECDEESYYSCYDSKPEATTTPVRSTAYDELVTRMKDKIISLQNEVIGNFAGGPSGRKISDNDLVRYSAMVDILKSMLGLP